MKSLNFNTDGAFYHNSLACEYLPNLIETFDILYDGSAGKRIVGNKLLNSVCTEIMQQLSLRHTIIDRNYVPVRAILFDKNQDINWSLGWHQDRTICVKDFIDTPNYGPWTIKQGHHHVEPPFSILEDMLTMRIHLDDVTADNAPLLIAKGTHKLGKVRQVDTLKTVKEYEEHICTALAGDIWIYSTPILHASKKSKIQKRRRVIQIDFSKKLLNGKLEFLGV